MARHFMNPAMGKHFGAEEREETAEGEGKKHGAAKGNKHMPDIHIKSHEHGHTVHILPHKDSNMAPETHEHEFGDVEGMSKHLHEHFGKAGQDHGGSSESGGATDELGEGLGLEL